MQFEKMNKSKYLNIKTNTIYYNIVFGFGFQIFQKRLNTVLVGKRGSQVGSDQGDSLGSLGGNCRHSAPQVPHPSGAAHHTRPRGRESSTRVRSLSHKCFSLPLVATNQHTTGQKRPTRSSGAETDSAHLLGGNREGHMVKSTCTGRDRELVSA